MECYTLYAMESINIYKQAFGVIFWIFFVKRCYFFNNCASFSILSTGSRNTLHLEVNKRVDTRIMRMTQTDEASI